VELLTDDQLNDIATAIAEDYGFELTEDEVCEMAGLVLEDIPGLESLCSAHLECLIKDIAGKYYDSAKNR
jgi:hypothetical protein